MARDTIVKLTLKGDNKDAKKSIDELSKVLKNLETVIKSTSGKVEIEGDASGAIKASKEAQGAVDSVQDENTTVLDGDESSLISSADNAEGAVEGIPDENTTVMNGDSSGVVGSADNAKGAINGVPDEHTTVLKADTSELTEGLEGLEKSFSSIAGAGAAVAGGGALLAKGFKSATDSAVELETGMAKVSTLISNDVNVDMDDLEKNLQNVALSTGATTTELSEGLYSALSAGVPVTEDMGDALSFVENASKLATAGFTDTEKAVDVTTTVINAYGLEISEAEKVMNTLIETQNAGKTTVDELASSMGKAIPGASQLGVNFQELSGGMAVMTANGIGTAEATTMMSAWFKEANDSGSVMNETMKDISGKTIPEYLAEGHSMEEAMSTLNGHLEEQGMNWGDITSSSEAATAAYTLTKDGGESLRETTARLSDDNYELDESFKKMSETVQFSKDVINQGITVAFQKLGDVILVVAAPALRFVADNIKWLAPVALTAVGAIGALLLIFGLVAAKTLITVAAQTAWVAITTIATTVTTLFGAAMALLTSPISLVVIAVGLLIYAFYKLMERLGLLEPAIEVIKKAFEVFGIMMNRVASSIKQSWGELLTWLNEKLTAFTEFLKSTFADEIEAVIKVFEEFKKATLDIFKDWLALFDALLAGDYAGAWEMFKVIVEKSIQAFKDLFSNLIPIIKDIIVKAYNLIKDAWPAVWEKFKEIVNEAIESFKKLISNLIPIIKDAFVKVYNVIKDSWPAVWDKFVEIVNLAVTKFFEILRNLPEIIVTIIGLAWKAIVAAWPYVWEGFKNIVKYALIALGALLASIPVVILGLIKLVGKLIVALWPIVWNLFKEIVKTALDWIYDFLRAFPGNFVKMVIKLTDNINKVFAKAWELFVDIVKKAIAKAIEWIKTLPGKFVEMVKTLIEKIKTFYKNAWELYKTIVKNAINYSVTFIKSLPGKFVEMVTSLIEKIRTFYRNAWEIFKTIVKNAINFAITFIKSLPGKFVEMVTSLKQRILNQWAKAWDKFKELAKKAIDATVDAFKSIPGKISDMISSFSSLVSSAWSNAWRTFANTPISAINLMLSGIERGMNSMLSGISSAASKAASIANKVPGVNISVGSAGSVSLPRVPYFAKGGIVDGAGLGVIGEAGPEMILPLNNQGAAFFDKILGDRVSASGNSSNSVNINIQGDMVAMNPEELRNNILNDVDEYLGNAYA